MSRRPPVAVVVPLRVAGASATVTRLVERFTTSALSLLCRSGADPWVVDTSAASRPPASAVARAAGVLLLGGGDIDPALYGVDGPVPELYGVDRDGDLQAIEIVRVACAARRPVLGICRGSQVLNVALGGTLVPHLVDTGTHRSTDPARPFVDEIVRVAPGAWVADVLGRTELKVRSGHHQAVDRTGAGLRAVAWGTDGVIEAVEHTSLWAKGVQWHPEDPDADPADAAALFGSFVAATAP